MKYKKYIVFIIECYYPNGGINDIAWSFSDRGEALAFCRSREFKGHCEIIDRDTWEVVEKIDVTIDSPNTPET